MASPSPGSVLRSRLGDEILVLPGVYDAITAKLARRAGFQALYLSGAGVTNSLTGFPDIALITLSEMVRQAAYVCRSAELPVVADADTGFGGLANVARAVSEYERAGLAGMHIEDQLMPKRCGHLEGKVILPVEEMTAKITAAAKARTDPSFFLIARTDARSVNGLNDAIDRAKRYLDAGADAIFPESLYSPDEFARFAREIDAPLMANMTEFGKTTLISAAEFGQMGYQMVIFPMSAFRVMMRAAEEFFKHLQTHGGQAEFLHRMQTRAELYELLDYASFDERESEVAKGGLS